MNEVKKQSPGYEDTYCCWGLRRRTKVRLVMTAGKKSPSLRGSAKHDEVNLPFVDCDLLRKEIATMDYIRLAMMAMHKG